jgi:hypothetical protein
MLLLILTQVWASEPTKEFTLSSVNQKNNASLKLGVDQLSSVELTVGYGLSEKIAVIASYGYGEIVTKYDTPYSEESYEDDYNQSRRAFESAFTQHMISVGPRYRHIFNDWGSVYGTLEGSLAMTTFDISTSLQEEDPVSKTNTSALSFGGSFAVGAMGSIRFKEDVPELILSFEMGYSLQSQPSYENMGPLDLSGMYSSLGCGVRF